MSENLSVEFFEFGKLSVILTFSGKPSSIYKIECGKRRFEYKIVSDWVPDKNLISLARSLDIISLMKQLLIFFGFKNNESKNNLIGIKNLINVITY